MEELWILRIVIGIIIPMGFVFFWMVYSYLERKSHEIKRRKMIHSKLNQLKSNVFNNPDYGHYEVNCLPFSEESIRRISFGERDKNFNAQISTILLHEDETLPPDIYVINERGKHIRYVMCV